MWRASSGILATQDLIALRIRGDPRCPLCAFSSDSISHALLSCPFAKHVWKSVPCSNLRRLLSAGSFMDLLGFFLLVLGGTLLLHVLVH